MAYTVIDTKFVLWQKMIKKIYNKSIGNYKNLNEIILSQTYNN